MNTHTNTTYTHTDTHRGPRRRQDDRWVPPSSILYRIHQAAAEPDQEDSLCQVLSVPQHQEEDGGDDDERGLTDRPQGGRQ